MYTLSSDYAETVAVDFDTVITGFQEYRKIDKITPFYASLGNYGLPLLELDFFKRNSVYDHQVYQFLKPYMHHTGNKTFIDTQVPFTEAKFTFGGPRTLAEQYLGLRHSQNVNRFLNVGLDLDIINSLGQYSYQSTDNRSFTLHSSYLGPKYKLYAAWSSNNMTRKENGGVIYEDSDITGVDNPSFLADYDTRDVAVNLGRLNSAESSLKNMNMILVQRYRVGGERTDKADTAINTSSQKLEGIFTHILSYDRTQRSYYDLTPLGGFYDTTYISNDTNNLYTNDSLFNRVFKNTFRFDFGTGESARFRLNLGVGIRNELNIYKQVVPTYNSQFADTISWKNSSNALIGRVYNRIGDKFSWESSGEIWFTGYRAGDFDLRGSISKLFGEGKSLIGIVGEGNLASSTPSWWQNSWGSNHFVWDNSFDKEVVTQAGGRLTLPGYNLKLSLDYALLTNHIYFGRSALPQQFNGSISLLSARLEKNFNLWKIRFNNQVLFQSVSHNDIIPLPLLAVKSTLFFDHEFYFESTNGKLKMQLGLEALYHTSYFASGFMPATGIFYLQDRTETGNYPYINAFASLKLKRTRIFVSMDHVNWGLSGYNYFMTPGYPMPVRTLKYGVAWTFYN
jgi:hypothetical protein